MLISSLPNLKSDFWVQRSLNEVREVVTACLNLSSKIVIYVKMVHCVEFSITVNSILFILNLGLGGLLKHLYFKYLHLTNSSCSTQTCHVSHCHFFGNIFKRQLWGFVTFFPHSIRSSAREALRPVPVWEDVCFSLFNKKKK